VDRLRRLRAGEPEPAPDPERPREAQQASPQGVSDRHSPQLPPEALELLERRLRGAGTGLLSESQLGGPGPALTALRDRGQAVRVSGRLYAHREVLDEVRASILAIIERDGSTRLGDVRDELGLSRKSAQAFLEHLDAARLTRRLPDDRRVAAGRAMPTGSGSR
jgi:selenocysteine-specific elongation factor